MKLKTPFIPALSKDARDHTAWRTNPVRRGR